MTDKPVIVMSWCTSLTGTNKTVINNGIHSKCPSGLTAYEIWVIKIQNTLKNHKYIKWLKEAHIFKA